MNNYYPRFLTTVIGKILVITVLVLISCLNLSSVMAGGLNAYEREAVALLNKDRAARGLPVLKVDMRLVELSRRHALDMIDKQYFSDTDTLGQTPLDRIRKAGVLFKTAGENIAADFSLQQAQAALMKNPVRRANILKKEFDRVGIGVARKQDGKLYLVQIFIRAAKHPLYEREQYNRRT